MALTRLAHQIINEHFEHLPKKLAVDATVGNGHDCEFLLRQKFKRVVGFDIQQKAINATRHRLKLARLVDVELIEDGHENMHSYINGLIDCCMFNFGYLPKADKQITTQTKTSLIAIDAAVKLLNTNGLISLMCYPGHDQGAIETQAIQHALDGLDNSFMVKEYLGNNPSPTTPILYTVARG